MSLGNVCLFLQNWPISVWWLPALLHFGTGDPALRHIGSCSDGTESLAWTRRLGQPSRGYRDFGSRMRGWAQRLRGNWEHIGDTMSVRPTHQGCGMPTRHILVVNIKELLARLGFTKNPATSTIPWGTGASLSQTIQLGGGHAYGEIVVRPISH